MASDRGDPRMPTRAGFARLPRGLPVPSRLFTPIKYITDKSRPFQYIVQVETRIRRTQQSVFRTITVTESERGDVGEILTDALNAIMDSPTSAREEPVGARMISARKYIG